MTELICFAIDEERVQLDIAEVQVQLAIDEERVVIDGDVHPDNPAEFVFFNGELVTFGGEAVWHVP